MLSKEKIKALVIEHCGDNKDYVALITLVCRVDEAASRSALETAIDIVNREDLSKDGYSNATRSRIASKLRGLINHLFENE